MAMTLTPLQGVPLVKPGDDLSSLLVTALVENGLEPEDGDILVLAQKIVSKAEGRLVNLTEVQPTEEARAYAQETGKDPRLLTLVLGESAEVLRTRENLIIVVHRLGFVCANAGIDHSNVEGPWGDPADWVLLLPENPDESARRIRRDLEEHFGCRLGVLIIDSHGRAWRLGTVGTAIGLSGLPGLVDLRGQADLFSYRLQATQVGGADELAAAASLVIGQAAEGTPAVLVRGFPYSLREGRLEELIRPKKLDLFR
jgi:coenzyme F420-0:L-glutamate ligase / coenzyme F420-1:gamma-L-glutamate ligase